MKNNYLITIDRLVNERIITLDDLFDKIRETSAWKLKIDYKIFINLDGQSDIKPSNSKRKFIVDIVFIVLDIIFQLNTMEFFGQKN